jgi:hypothetical protein
MEETLGYFSYSLDGLRSFITLVDTFLNTRQDAFLKRKLGIWLQWYLLYRN